jgi:hypothetical protein
MWDLSRLSITATGTPARSLDRDDHLLLPDLPRKFFDSYPYRLSLPMGLLSPDRSLAWFLGLDSRPYNLRAIAPLRSKSTDISYALCLS